MTPAPRRAAAAALVLALAQAGCATPPGLEPGRPLEVAALPLPPYQSHEECMTLAPGDRLQYRFESTAPLAFNIHYHEGKAVVMPLSRERVGADEGTFAPLVAQDYCLMWEAGAESATIAYTLRLTRSRPR